MAYRITRAEFMQDIRERERALAQMTDAKHFVCPACFTVTRIDSNRPSGSERHCWCDHESGDIDR